MPQFVILRHESPQGTHFDFMLESGGMLKTWALPRPPESGAVMQCEALADHRLIYLGHQGPISGGRGSVTCWDHGTYALQQQSDAEWVVELAGEKLSGLVALRRIAGDSSQWTLVVQEKGQSHFR